MRVFVARIILGQLNIENCCLVDEPTVRLSQLQGNPRPDQLIVTCSRPAAVCACMIFLRNTRVMQDARAKVNEEAKVSVANARVRERDYAKYLDNKIESPPDEFSSFRNFVN